MWRELVKPPAKSSSETKADSYARQKVFREMCKDCVDNDDIYLEIIEKLRKEADPEGDLAKFILCDAFIWTKRNRNMITGLLKREWATSEVDCRLSLEELYKKMIEYGLNKREPVAEPKGDVWERLRNRPLTETDIKEYMNQGKPSGLYEPSTSQEVVKPKELPPKEVLPLIVEKINNHLKHSRVAHDPLDVKVIRNHVTLALKTYCDFGPYFEAYGKTLYRELMNPSKVKIPIQMELSVLVDELDNYEDLTDAYNILVDELCPEMQSDIKRFLCLRN